MSIWLGWSSSLSPTNCKLYSSVASGQSQIKCLYISALWVKLEVKTWSRRCPAMVIVDPKNVLPPYNNICC